MTQTVTTNETKSIGKRFLDYLIKTLNGMAFGLFATLIVGTIIRTIGTYVIKWDGIIELAVSLQRMMGIGIGIGVAWSLDLKGLRLIMAGVAGGIATSLAAFVGTDIAPIIIGREMTIGADPMVTYLTVVFSIQLLGIILKKKTPIDIILIPLLSAVISFLIVLIVTIPVASMMSAIGRFIIFTTNATPFIMGIVIAVVIGMALTAPISSAAIAVSIYLGTDAVQFGFSAMEAATLGIAGGAALAGCCAQMLGFAVMSRKDNSIGTVISIGIGTSMLQFKNVLKKPIIWLPPILASVIVGPLSTVVFKMTTERTGAGMGTSGLVGQVATLSSMGPSFGTFLAILIVQIALPILLVFGLDLFFRKKGWIKEGDLKV